MQPENTAVACGSDLHRPQLTAADGSEPESATLRKPQDVATGLGSMVTRLRHLQLARFSGLYLWALIIAIFSIAVPSTFLTSTTWDNIAATQAITAIVAVGLLGALAAGSFDLSVGSNLGLAAIMCSWLTVNHHVNPVLGVMVTIAVGLLIGAVNAGLVVGIGIDSFIVTLGVSSILLAVTELISQDRFIGPLPTSLQNFANWRFLGLTGVVWYAIGIAIVVWTVLEHTAAGRRTAATGANLEAARLSGVATNRHRVVTLIVSATLASLAGALVAARTGEVSSTIGAPYLLPAFSACFLGTTQLKPGRFNVWGTILALLLLGTGVTGLQLLGGQLWVSDMFTGAALVLAVAFAALGQKQRLRRLKKQTEAEAA
jgi:ribose transport system permease protein